MGLGSAAWPWTLPPKALGLRAVRSRYIDKGVGNCGVGVGSVRIPVGILFYWESEMKIGTHHPQWVKDVGQLLLPLPIRKNSEVSLH